jgi:hypothetical protein
MSGEFYLVRRPSGIGHVRFFVVLEGRKARRIGIEGPSGDKETQGSPGGVFPPRKILFLQKLELTHEGRHRG